MIYDDRSAAYVPHCQRAHITVRPNPRRGQVGQAKQIADISASPRHRWCAPQQGALQADAQRQGRASFRKGSDQDHLAARGAARSAAMASEILISKTILETELQTHFCDAINTAMRELFPCRSSAAHQSAFSGRGPCCRRVPRGPGQGPSLRESRHGVRHRERAPIASRWPRLLPRRSTRKTDRRYGFINLSKDDGLHQRYRCRTGKRSKGQKSLWSVGQRCQVHRPRQE